jgi:hypothetical protein
MLSNAIVAPIASTSWMHAAATQLEPRLQFEVG